MVEVEEEEKLALFKKRMNKTKIEKQMNISFELMSGWGLFLMFSFLSRVLAFSICFDNGENVCI